VFSPLLLLKEFDLPETHHQLFRRLFFSVPTSSDPINARSLQVPLPVSWNFRLPTASLRMAPLVHKSPGQTSFSTPAIILDHSSRRSFPSSVFGLPLLSQCSSTPVRRPWGLLYVGNSQSPLFRRRILLSTPPAWAFFPKNLLVFSALRFISFDEFYNLLPRFFFFF